MNRTLIWSASFVRASKHLLKRNHQAALDVEATLEVLSADAFDPRLKSHKLSGTFEDCWACKAAYDLRIIFEFVTNEGSEAIVLHTVGTHDDVY